MRCWFIHTWSKWKRYEAVYEETLPQQIPLQPGMWTTYSLTTETPRKVLEARQERICQRCGYTQDRKIRER